MTPSRCYAQPANVFCPFFSVYSAEGSHCSLHLGSISEQRRPVSPFLWHFPSSRGRQTNEEYHKSELQGVFKGEEHSGKKTEQGKLGRTGGTLHQALETTAGTWALVPGEVSGYRDSFEQRGGGTWDVLYKDRSAYHVENRPEGRKEGWKSGVWLEG